MDLREEILGREDCTMAVAARDIATIAKLVSAGRTATQTRYVTGRTILAECAQGGAILDGLEAASLDTAKPYATSTKWALKFLEQDSGLNVGDPVTQGLLDILVMDGHLTAEQATELKNLAILPAPVTPQQVADALYHADGSTK